jgi:hypothetical protein
MNIVTMEIKVITDNIKIAMLIKIKIKIKRVKIQGRTTISHSNLEATKIASNTINMIKEIGATISNNILRIIIDRDLEIDNSPMNVLLP